MQQLENYLNGHWQRSGATNYRAIHNPATTQVLAEVPFSPASDVDAAVQAAQAAFPGWRSIPVGDRIQFLFKLKHLLETNLEDIARTITEECGKTFDESVGELRRGIENVEVACGMPSLIQGYNNEDIARGIDEHLFRQPLGVVAAITPFNFPGMIPLWFMPYALATGNCFILKPSEQVPLTSAKLFQLLDQLDLPAGVVQLLHGDKETVNALLDHPGIRAVSFVGSTPVARAIYQRATAAGKRVQAQGGAKNPIVIMPDADFNTTTQIVADSAFGCAGQRCLAASLAVTVGEARGTFTEQIADAASTRRVGYGLDAGIQMGPVISPTSKERILGCIDAAINEGGRLVIDGRERQVEGYSDSAFLCPTVIEEVNPNSTLVQTEVFGPVLGLLHAATLDEAIERINASPYGNMASIFTSSGAAARQFRHDVRAGNIGVNIGVAAPMAYFPFSGWKESFFGDLHAQGRHGVEFYTETKVVVERWPSEWSRRF